MWQRCNKHKLFFSVLVFVSLLTTVVSGTLTYDVNALGTNSNPTTFRELRSQLISPDLLNKELALNNSNDTENINNTNGNAHLPSYNLSDSDLVLLSDTATTYADNNLSLEIGGQGLNEAVKILPGQVAYRAHTVKVTSSNIKSYTLTINGPIGLKNTNAASTTSNNTITGAGGKTPASMANNSWGYAYGQTGSNDSMTYSSFTGGSQQLDKASSSPNFTKNLVFAAKFADNAEAGHYQATVNLSLTATPKVITTYTLSYNANNGSNAPSTQTYTDDTEAGSHTFTISSSKPSRSGYEFSSWNTNSSGTGTNYNPSGTITLSASNPTQTLYAKWAQIYTRTLSYNMNGGTGGPSSQSCSSTSTSCSITISSTKPTKTNYTFLGWSTSSTATSASYQPGGSITLSSNTTLYAMWKAKTLADITTMQEMTPDICKNTAVGTSKSLKDTRDEKTYTVRKFADGRCWMVENLKLKLTTAGLSKDDTDLNQGADWNQSSPSTVVKPTNTLTSLTSTNFPSSNYYAVESYIASSSNAGETGYYSWNAATAGTGGTANTTGNFVPANSQAPSSICPKGWKLPTGGSSGGEFYGLTSAENIYTILTGSDSTQRQQGSAKMQAAPYNFKYTGYVGNGSLVGGTTYGRWWSSTASSATNAYVLLIGGSGVNPGALSNARYVGFAVRCIARDS